MSKAASVAKSVVDVASGGAISSAQAAKDAKNKQKEIEKQQKQQAALDAAEQARQDKLLAESTPWGAMSTTARIAAEKSLLARRAGRGSAAKSRQTSKLG